MKAIVQKAYGLQDVLNLDEVDQPVPGDDEVLVEVEAAALHVGDWMVMQGVPYVMRLGLGLRSPRVGIPGLDLAGRVVGVGKEVHGVQAGDEVFGEGKGACAEYAVVASDKMVPKPEELSFEEAAALPVSGATALRGIRDAGKVNAGQKVLINGATGGVGVYAVQIAKALGAEVTGVCGPSNVDLLQSLGADHVVDYTKADYTKGTERYDLILDNVANHPFAESRKALTPDGSLISNSGRSDGRIFGAVGRMARAAIGSVFIRQQGRPFYSPGTKQDLLDLLALIDDGKLRPVVDRAFPLAETAAAMEYVGKGHASGKIVIAVR